MAHMSYIQQKKKVQDKYCPDTFRVISDDAVQDHPKYRPMPYRSSFEPRTPTPQPLQMNNNAEDTENAQPMMKSTKVLPQLLPDHRANNPHPLHCGFLNKNVRFLNEPICDVYTASVRQEERHWWPARANPGELRIPPFTEDTWYRTNYNYKRGERPGGAGRHTANMNREPALGAIPVNILEERDGNRRFYKEDLSYEHMYDCRADPSYPVRGKRHGSFVWRKLDPISQRKFQEYFERLEAEQKAAKQNGQEIPLSSETGVHVIRSINHKASSRQSSSKYERSIVAQN